MTTNLWSYNVTHYGPNSEMQMHLSKIYLSLNDALVGMQEWLDRNAERYRSQGWVLSDASVSELEEE